MKKIIKSLLIGVLVILAIIVFALTKLASNAKPAEPTAEAKRFDNTQKKWETATYEDKQQWIETMLKNADLAELDVAMSKAIRKQFKYPEEVSFKDYPFMKNATVGLADTGFVFVSGKLTAKNAFGVKSGYNYRVRNIVRPDTIYIDNITINELK